MTLFVDASAFVAIIHEEPEQPTLTSALNADPVRITSGLAMWEAARALGRLSGGDTHAGMREVERYCSMLGIRTVAIGSAEAKEAVDAHARYGKGTGHPARLNMGDCFAYACARTHHAQLLYKGDDFAHTDLRLP